MASGYKLKKMEVEWIIRKNEIPLSGGVVLAKKHPTVNVKMFHLIGCEDICHNINFGHT